MFGMIAICEKLNKSLLWTDKDQNEVISKSIL